MDVKMNHILKILYLLTLSKAIMGKTIQNPVEDDYHQRYAQSHGIGTSAGDKDQFGYREDQLKADSGSPVGPQGNLGVVEYASDDFTREFNAIVQKLQASLAEPSPLIGPLPLPLPPVNPLIDPLHYGSGAPTALPVNIPRVTVTGRSIPWDTKTRSFGGWVPLKGPRKGRAKIVTRKYVNGQLYKVRSKPISLAGKTIIIKRRPE